MQVKVLKCYVLIIDYRGFGNSQSEPSEEGLALDAEATLEHALNDPDIDNDKLYVFGRSIGGSVSHLQQPGLQPLAGGQQINHGHRLDGQLGLWMLQARPAQGARPSTASNHAIPSFEDFIPN